MMGLISMESSIREAMKKLEEIPSGGVGEYGHTAEELSVCEEQGVYAEGDATYHTVQRAWLILRGCLEDD